MEMERKKILIFCDGGFGNRYNALISGLAVAKDLDLHPEIYWPTNNWCRAPFERIFKSSFSIYNISLTKLAGKTNRLLPLLHDESASKILNCSFNSAYSYQDMAELNSVLAAYEGIFFYPALVPPYINNEQLALSIKSLEFDIAIGAAVIQFIENELRMPFYGVHLRRTDLNVGLTDFEVNHLVTGHPESLFFICSDDPIAEKIASIYQNVRIREKRYHVEKRSPREGWNAITLDDDSRPYQSNIDRGAESVIESVIDLLLLAHSTIVGYSGSTFQSVARMIGVHDPLVNIGRPLDIDFISIIDVQKKIALKRLSVFDVIEISRQLIESDRAKDAILVLKNALNNFNGKDAFPILFNLAHYLMASPEGYGEADIFLQRAIETNPEFTDTYILRAQNYKHLGMHEVGLKCVLDGLLSIKGSGQSDKKDVLLLNLRDFTEKIIFLATK